MRRRVHNKARNRSVAYAATITFTPGSGEVSLQVGQLTGALALNIVDANAEVGDELKVFLQADATPRTVTLGGAQGKAGTVALGANVDAVLILTYNPIIGKYASNIIPT